jgi:hypothetical protein
MRLINTKTFKLEEFFGPSVSYAILSHTWGQEEVTFQDFQDPGLYIKKAGFAKIRLSCEQARKDGLDYAWVDTCCIDKTSSAELSEAINSMFKWYEHSAICYAYLEAVPQHDNIRAKNSAFTQSRWFTRGWTLQELIAPRRLDFYCKSWIKIGEKSEIIAEIGNVTGIDADVLKGGSLSNVSVARRMSWAANRQTTRAEDIAYCLLGIFDVNMPMLYGEGQKAFIRLQKEILKECEDHTLFAWRATPESARGTPYRGVLATSPAEFASCGYITPSRDLRTSTNPLTITNRGLHITSQLENWVPQGLTHTIVLGLNCRQGNDFRESIGIYLLSQGGDQYVRIFSDEITTCQSHG